MTVVKIRVRAGLNGISEHSEEWRTSDETGSPSPSIDQDSSTHTVRGLGRQGRSEGKWELMDESAVGKGPTAAQAGQGSVTLPAAAMAPDRAALRGSVLSREWGRDHGKEGMK